MVEHSTHSINLNITAMESFQIIENTIPEKEQEFSGLTTVYNGGDMDKTISVE